MKALLVTLGMVGLLSVTTQLLRHLYVGWLAPTTSVLDKYDDKIEKDIAAFQSLEEMQKKYDEVQRQIKALPDQDMAKVNIFEEPYKSENKLRSAIQTWESRSREIMELHFFWWCGLFCAAGGMAGFMRGQRWFAIALLTTGFVEMIYWTSPTIRFFGGGLEFERLLTWKIIYTAATLVLILAFWVYLDRITRPVSADRQGAP